MAVEQTSRCQYTFKKQCLPVITWNKKYLSKHVVTIAYTLEKKFFAVAIYEALGVVSYWAQ